MKNIYQSTREALEVLKTSYEYKVEGINVRKNEFTFSAGGKRRIRRGKLDNVVQDESALFLFDKQSIYRLTTAYNARQRGDLSYAELTNKNNKIAANLGLFLFLSGLYLAVFLSTNIFAGRFIHIFGMTLPGGIYGFPLTFAILDILTEHFGAKTAYKAIITGILNLYIFVGLIYAYYYLGPMYVTPQNKETITALSDALYRVFFYRDNILWVILTGSLAIALSDVFNCFLMSYFKKKQVQRNLWLRCLLATFIAEAVFTVSWLTTYSLKTGYLPSNQILWASVSQTIVKSTYEVFMLPATYLIILFFRKNELSEYAREKC